MTTLSEEKVLRINCPGFGVSSVLPLGEAKPLAMYDVIIVNPVSGLHLFDNKSDISTQIEQLQADGMTSYRVEDDSLLDSLTAELDLRTQELAQFLKKGGLLIYFLTPPFVMQGQGSTMDNYSWLGQWGPDKPQAPNQRNLSASIRGKAIDPTAEAEDSVWMPYLKQAGVEWTTIVRYEHISDGFIPLANAGANKCIAAFRPSGPKGGQVVFLPSPYGKELDAKLKECLDRWFSIHSGEEVVGGDTVQMPAVERKPLTEPVKAAEKPAEKPIELPPAAHKEEEKPPVPMPSCSASAEPELKMGWMKEQLDEAKPEPAAGCQSSEPAASCAAKEKDHKDHVEPQKNPAETVQFFDFDKKAEPCNNGDAKTADCAQSFPAPEAKDLMRKMENEVNRPDAPQWCQNYSFTELDGLRQQLTNLNEEMRLAQIKAVDLQTRIEQMEDLKNSLLSSEGEQLMHACSRVFEMLGWTVKPALGNSDELWLLDGDKTQAIVRLVYTTSQPNRSELAALAESVITYWGAHEVEPKGILVASTWADRPPQERTDEDYSESMNEFAKRKNLCLLSTSQILSIYRDMAVNETDPREIRNNVLTTNGQVVGFRMEMSRSAVKPR